MSERAEADGDAAGQRRSCPPPDFRVLFESAPESYLVVDPQLVIVAVSEAYLRNTMTRRADIIGKGIFEVFPDNPEDPEASGEANLRSSLDRVCRDLVADTMAVQRYDIRRPESAGGGFEVRYWSPLNSPVLGPLGRLAYIIHRVEDVTEYVRLRDHQTEQQRLAEKLQLRTQQMDAEILTRSRELEDANRALRAANEAKSEFLSRVSHELRSPLNAVLGFGELLSLGEITAEQREWVSMMLKAARHLLLLLDDVLDISRIEARKLSLSMEAVPVGSLLADSVELVRPLSMSRGVRLDPAPGLESNLYVQADHQRLRQVLLNLLSNAIKYNHPAGNVAITADGRPGDRLRISVIDTGRGIAEGDIDRLFTPFERLDAAKAGFEGTGLGLALSRQLIEAMGGTTGVTSRHGEGSVFWIELPTTEPVAVSQLAIERDAIVASRPYTTPKTVLYVEDMVENLLLVEQILKQRPSTTVIPAMLAEVALDLARQHRPDLILLDLHLPDMPGEKVLSRLRADPATSGIPVVILSADATQHQISRLLANGAAAYLTKPISVRTLLETADSVLGDPEQPPQR